MTAQGGAPRPPGPRIVIAGAGFGGLNCARRLRGAGTEVILVDRRNFHLFQPLLYQVATAMLSPADITATLRAVLRGREDVRTLCDEITGFDLENRQILLGDRRLGYDYLVVGTGFQTRYPRGRGWERHARGLKSVEDALEIRGSFLSALEEAEWEKDPAARQRLLTSVVIGAGPTGVELAGALAAVAREAVPREFRTLGPSDTRIVLLEAGPTVLPGFPEPLQRKAAAALTGGAVDVRTGCAAEEIDSRGVRTSEGWIPAATVVWAAAVGASSLASQLPAETGSQGRLRVAPDCSLPGFPEVFVIGDLALIEQQGNIVPAVAPAAIQMGRHVAAAIRADLHDSPRPHFRYLDKGQLATVGSGIAVARIGGRDFGGRLAWALWGGVHIAYLIGFRDRISVLSQWFWSWLTRSRQARLITYACEACGCTTGNCNCSGEH